MPKKKGVGQNEFRHGRTLDTPDKPGFKIGYDNSWAVVIGIDHYEDDNIRNLKHAVNDAKGMAELLINNLGFLKDNVYVILDPAPPPGEITGFSLTGSKATKETIEKLLLTDIPDRIKKDDRLLIFYAGHGERRPIAERKQGIGYLVPSSAKSGEWHTYVEMSAIIQVLNWSAAKHIFYLLDCCYSGLATARANPKVSDFTEVCLSNRALECLTAGTAKQAVDDDGPEGHSTFTWTVIQGLKKEADWNGDDIITGTDLMVYVKNKLISTYGELQTPDFGYFGGHESGGDFVFRLPELSSRDFFNLGVRLYDLGQRIDDPGRFESASRHFEKALVISRSAGASSPETELWLGKSLLAAEQTDEALKVLKKLTEGDPSETPAEAWLQLGMANAKKQDFAGAKNAFEKFLSCNPQNKNAEWVRDFTEQMCIKRRALLIGINEYKSESLTLRGCVNDVSLIKEILQKKFGFEEADIITLTNGTATKLNVLTALNGLANCSTTADAVIVYYSGWGLGIVGSRLLVHDSEYDQNKPNDAGSEIDYELLHQLLNQIPAKHKLFILDGNTISDFVEIVNKKALYQLIMASSPGNFPLEVYTDIGGKFGYSGALSSSLYNALAEVEAPLLSYCELVDIIIDKLKKKDLKQTPIFIGDAKQLVLGQKDFHLFFWNIAQLKNYESFEVDDLTAWYDKFTKLSLSFFPLAHLSFGHAFVQKGDYIKGIEAINTALRQLGNKDIDTIFSLGKAHLTAQQYSEAYKNFQHAADLSKTLQKSIDLSALTQASQRLSLCSRYALLVGIDTYFCNEIPSLRGAVNDVYSFKDTLVTRCRFPLVNITVLLNGEATRSAILDQFKRLADISQKEPVLFYFAGYGSIGRGGLAALVSTDARQNDIEDIAYDELAALSHGTHSNLVAIIDAGVFIAPTANEAIPENRALPRFRTKNKKPGGYQGKTQEGENRDQPRIGAIEIYTRNTVETTASKIKRKKPEKVHGTMTYSLLKVLEKKDLIKLTYRMWFNSFPREHRKRPDPTFLGEDLDMLLFIPFALHRSALDLVENIELAPFFELIEMLQRVIDHNAQRPEGYLNLGLAYAAVGEYQRSIQKLQTAVNLFDDPTIMEQEKLFDPKAEEIQRQSRFHLGRVLYERKQELGKAVDELRKAQKQDPDDTRVNYYLGQAIRALVEQETLTEASDALQKYIDKGAPLGRRKEVMDFLKSRQLLK
jgi:tetratricopeptide (TPR) repeat protein